MDNPVYWAIYIVIGLAIALGSAHATRPGGPMPDPRFGWPHAILVVLFWGPMTVGIIAHDLGSRALK